jgi:hypothetical protein
MTFLIKFSGVLVQTLGSLWFFELTSSGETEVATEVSYKVHKLAVSGLFWSLKFDLTTRMFLASTKPTPHARHMVRKKPSSSTFDS